MTQELLNRYVQQRDALEEARNSGALIVRYGDKEVTYRSLVEIDRVLSDLNAIISGKGKKRVVYPIKSKGFY